MVWIIFLLIIRLNFFTTKCLNTFVAHCSSMPVSDSYFSALNVKNSFSVSLICFRHCTGLSESHGEVPQQTEEKDQLGRQPKGKTYSSIIMLFKTTDAICTSLLYHTSCGDYAVLGNVTWPLPGSDPGMSKIRG